MNKSLLFMALMPLVAIGACQAQVETDQINSRDLRGDIVYEDANVVFRQIDQHTWIGNGNRVYNESVYIVEGSERALLIDAGTHMPGLDSIVSTITSKPVTLVLTHAHNDHIGAVSLFDKIYLNAGDMTIIPARARSAYADRFVFLSDGEVIDLGGREIEVVFTPGHTAGSASFFDKKNHYGFSGDAFGSTNLLVFTNLSTQMFTSARIERYMKENDIRYMFPGHYGGGNLETQERVTYIKEMCREVLDGEREPLKSSGNSGGNDMSVQDHGVTINFSSRTGLK